MIQRIGDCISSGWEEFIKWIDQCWANNTKEILSLSITSAVTSRCPMVSLLDTGPTSSSAGAHQMLLAAFHAQLWPLEKGPPPPPLLTLAKGTLTRSPNVAVHLHSLLPGHWLAPDADSDSVPAPQAGGARISTLLFSPQRCTLGSAAFLWPSLEPKGSEYIPFARQWGYSFKGSYQGQSWGLHSPLCSEGSLSSVAPSDWPSLGRFPERTPGTNTYPLGGTTAGNSKVVFCFLEKRGKKPTHLISAWKPYYLWVLKTPQMILICSPGRQSLQ